MANKDHYTYRVTWSGEDQEYIGLCAEFPSLSWLDESPQTALAGIMQVVAEVVDDMEKNGEKAPDPFAERTFSGRFMVRVPPDTHRSLAIKAAEAGTSLNRIISEKLAR
ncbi:MAG: type II toxin-antitoxin system HicB family antitoxin [Desulfobacteraceae bacterium]|nr:type II toxin-antitoxin system HicB family antitoxin [Desulfobacteraceae bacterium]